MKSIKKYIVVSPILLCLLVSTCTPIISFAVNDLNTRVVDVGCPEPLVSENAGYIVLQPRYSQLPNIEQKPFVVSWIIYPKDGETSVPVELTVDDDSVEIALTRAIDCMMQITVYSQASSQVQYYFAYSNNPARHTIDFYDYMPLDLTVPFMAVSGNVGELIDNRSNSSALSLSLLWSDTSEQYHLLSDQLQTLLLMYSSLETNLEYDLLFLNLLESIYNSVATTDLTLQDISAELIEVYSLLTDYLKKIYNNTDSTVAILDRIWEDFYYWTWTVDEHHESIIRLLEQALHGETPPNQDSMQDSYDDYADIEQDLINNEEASNAIGDFDVSIEGGAYSVIWNMITDFLNSNSKVFGLFIACLTLAFIALLLHR